MTVKGPLWIIKTECGYKVETYLGDYLCFFTMAADCKAYVQELGVGATVVNHDGFAEYHTYYNEATKKELWWQTGGNDGSTY